MVSERRKTHFMTRQKARHAHTHTVRTHSRSADEKPNSYFWKPLFFYAVSYAPSPIFLHTHARRITALDPVCPRAPTDFSLTDVCCFVCWVVGVVAPPFPHYQPECEGHDEAPPPLTPPPRRQTRAAATGQAWQPPIPPPPHHHHHPPPAPRHRRPRTPPAARAATPPR